ncbi:hypothetical protein BpHYR1_014982 [Brachionus plicatilis]|uniref:Uncharacterized protein n=1 Tax=Brachionus plicatilis TaxID=10195 RepID=A0A3M7SW05_BRAPC|nr:hypothetical protein BpHYR1_014982 [Brachionus plicatilis]
MNTSQDKKKKPIIFSYQNPHFSGLKNFRTIQSSKTPEQEFYRWIIYIDGLKKKTEKNFTEGKKLFGFRFRSLNLF